MTTQQVFVKHLSTQFIPILQKLPSKLSFSQKRNPNQFTDDEIEEFISTIQESDMLEVQGFDKITPDLPPINLEQWIAFMIKERCEPKSSFESILQYVIEECILTQIMKTGLGQCLFNCLEQPKRDMETVTNITNTSLLTTINDIILRHTIRFNFLLQGDENENDDEEEAENQQIPSVVAPVEPQISRADFDNFKQQIIQILQHPPAYPVYGELPPH